MLINYNEQFDVLFCNFFIDQFVLSFVSVFLLGVDRHVALRCPFGERYYSLASQVAQLGSG